jgi:hypothetical protein
MTESLATTLRNTMIQDIQTMLGGNMVGLELDHQTIDLAIKLALDKYRARSSSAVEEAHVFLTILPNINEYTLPEETIDVRQLFRRRMGSGGSDGSSGGMEYDPFDIAFTNIYLLQAGSMGGLLTYNLYNQYLNTAGSMFGAIYDWSWNEASRKLQIFRAPRAQEEILMQVYKYIPDEMLLKNSRSKMWIFDCAVAYTKKMLGEAREKYSQLAGPQGGVSLNGAALKSEAEATLDKLDIQLREWQDGSIPLGIFKG